MKKDYNWRTADWTNPEDHSALTALDYIKHNQEVSLGGHAKEFVVSKHYGINTVTPKENRRYFVTTIKKEVN